MKFPLYRLGRRLTLVPTQIEKILLNQGRLLSRMNKGVELPDLTEYEFQIFSQWGEDGIIQRLIDIMPGIPKSFIEFGVEDFEESNCRFLMMKDNWSGYIIDGSPDHIRNVKQENWYWRHSLTAVSAFIRRDNIVSLLEGSGFGREPGILSVDIDGVDFFILQELDDWRPWIVIVEYNGLFGCERAVSVPYDPSFNRQQKHFSGQYWGASLKAFHALLAGRGYQLVGTNSVGSNAFFVRADKVIARAEPAIEEVFRAVSFRDSRDQSGNLDFLSQSARTELIADLPLMDTISGEMIKVADLHVK